MTSHKERTRESVCHLRVINFRVSENGATVRGCRLQQYSTGGVGLFLFPTDPKMRKKWIAQVKRTRARWEGPSAHAVLCSVHFTADCFENGGTDVLQTYGNSKEAKTKARSCTYAVQEASSTRPDCTTRTTSKESKNSRRKA